MKIHHLLLHCLVIKWKWRVQCLLICLIWRLIHCINELVMRTCGSNQTIWNGSLSDWTTNNWVVYIILVRKVNWVISLLLKVLSIVLRLLLLFSQSLPIALWSTNWISVDISQRNIIHSPHLVWNLLSIRNLKLLICTHAKLYLSWSHIWLSVWSLFSIKKASILQLEIVLFLFWSNLDSTF